MRFGALLMILALIATGSTAQETFSCPWGDRAACLGFGDTVCSSSGKCVSAAASCFDSYQCNYEGFTCRSNLTDCVDDYDGLLVRFNSLVDDYNELLEEFEVTQEYLEETRLDLLRSNAALAEIWSCIEGLGHLDDPTDCLP